MNPLVAVVGFCASGKSSVVAGLQARGIRAEAVAQEHSGIDDLWDHHTPDYLIFLDVTLDAVRERRQNPRWPAWIYELQRERLAAARVRADLVIDTDDADLNAVIAQVVRFLAGSSR